MSAVKTPPRVSQGWLLLACTSLGLSAVAALVLVLARTPLLTALIPVDAFPRALVVHVNLATLIWYFAMAGALWTERIPASRLRLSSALLALGATGATGVVLSGVLAPGAPVLANYVPYIDNPLFLGSLSALGLACLAVAGLTLSHPRDAAEWGFVIARGPFVLAGLYLAAASSRGIPLTDALWGSGHILQFGFVTLMMAIWLRLAERSDVASPPPAFAILLFVAAALPAAVAPALLAGGFEHARLHDLHTEIMRWGNWPPALLFGALLLSRPQARNAPGLAPSFGLYCIGILAGVAIETQTTMVPAHYHGTIGAFTLAQMAAVIVRISPSGRSAAAARPSLRPLSLYALGTLSLIAGLAWSGLLGAPRKTAFATDGADVMAILAATLTGIGGAITITGVAYFAILALPRILELCRTPKHPDQPASRAAAATFAGAP